MEQPPSETSLSARCGGQTTTPKMSANAVVLSLPGRDPDTATLYEPEVAREILRSVVESWQPDWASWITRTVRSAQERGAQEPAVGWLTYLHGDRPVPATLPEPARVSPLGEGALIQLGNDADAVTAEMVLPVRAELERAGALTPMS